MTPDTQQELLQWLSQARTYKSLGKTVSVPTALFFALAEDAVVLGELSDKHVEQLTDKLLRMLKHEEYIPLSPVTKKILHDD